MEVELTDEALLEKYRQNNDVSSFKALVRRYQNRVFNTAYRILGNKEEAEEVVQDTFVNIHQGMEKFRNNESTFASWTLRIAHNLCMDTLRQRRRKREVPVIPFILRTTADQSEGELIEPGQQQVADISFEPAQKLDIKEESEVIETSLRNLPESQRAVLILHDIEGFAYHEIADIIGASIGTVRSRLHYGRIKLKEMLDSYYSSHNQPMTPR